MTNQIEKILYFDPQQAFSCSCPRCSSAVYGPGYHCIRCQRDGHDT